MMQVFRVFWDALKNFWEELFLLVLMNIVTILLAIPVLTFPPALAGLWTAANRVANGKSIHWSDYFEGFRHYFWKAWGLALLNILVALVVLVNVRFYALDVVPFDISPSLSMWIRAFFVGAAILWLIVQIYPMALLLEQYDKRLRVALRNAAVLFIAHPGFSILLALLLLIVAGLSTVIPVLWILVTLALFGVVCNRAAVHLLEPYRERARAEEADKAAEEGSGEAVRSEGGH
jgi:uncharacterized membrane protein YesL